MRYRKQTRSVLAKLLACVMVFSLVFQGLPYQAGAGSSSEILEEIEELQNKADEIQQQKDDLAAQIAQNQSDTEDIVAEKNAIDHELKLLYDEAENINALIQNYNLLIAEKQEELDDALERQAKLNEEYKVRLRAMEENGQVSYWSILFQASSFLDLLDQVNMISEIAERDQRMLAEIDAVAREIGDTQAELEEDKAALETAKLALEESEAKLDEKRAESDAILKKLVEDAEAMREMYQEAAAQEKALSDQIAASEKAYNDARKKEEEASKPKPPVDEDKDDETTGEGNDGEDENDDSSGSVGSEGFIWPVSGIVTSAYGYREDPIYGGTAFHSGIDIGANMGRPIAAARSGVVTQAAESSIWGFYVVINHGDGYSTLYAHMTSYTVSVGQSMSQGQTIGYVGSSGKSNGPHLHFNIYYDGKTVNPAEYL